MPRPKRREPYRVFYRPDKRAWVVEYGHGKERGQKLCPPETKGEVAAKKWAAENYGEAVPIKRETHSLSYWYDRFVDERWKEAKRARPRFSPATVANNESHGKAWIKPRLGAQPIDQVGSPELRQFIRDVRDAGRGPQTVRNVYYSLVAFFDDVMAENWAELKTNPARHPGVVKELPELDSKRGGEGVITMPIESASALIRGTVVPIFRRAQYTLHFTIALRPGEGPGLRVGDVDLGAGTIRVNRQVANYSPDRTRATSVRDPKRGSKRTLPLHPAALEGLREWLGEWEIYVGRKPQAADPLFPSPEGEHFRGRQAGVLRDDLEALGLPTESKGAPLTLQAVRRSCSSWLRTLGVASDVRSRLLGHADKDVTGEHYTDADVENLRAAVALLPFTWNGGFADPNAAPGSGSETKRQESTEAWMGFEPTYDGFANSTDAGPGALASSQESDEQAEEPPSPAGPTGRQRSELGSVTTPAAEGFAATNSERVTRLEKLAELEPSARPGLALARGLDAAYRGDMAEVERELGTAVAELGLTRKAGAQ